MEIIEQHRSKERWQSHDTIKVIVYIVNNETSVGGQSSIVKLWYHLAE